MNKFYPFYFHFSEKNDPRLWPQIVFSSEFRFCEVIYIGNQPHFE